MKNFKFIQLSPLNLEIIFVVTVFFLTNSILCIELIEKPSITKNHICKTPSCLQAAQIILENIDTTVDPCDNFYQFACGKYLNDSFIREDSSGVSVFGEAFARIYQQLKETFEKPVNSDDPKTFQLLKSYYDICMDNETIKMTSTKKLEELLNELGGWPVVLGDSWNETTYDWKDIIYKLRRMGYSDSMNSLISFKIDVNEKNNTEYVITLDQAWLGLEQDYLLKGIQNKVVQAYYKYTVELAIILGADKLKAEREMLDSLNFEIKLAKISSSKEERRNMSKLYNPITVKELELMYSTIPWSDYLNEFLKPHFQVQSDQQLIIKDLKFFKRLSKLLSKIPKRTLANYVICRVVQESTTFMNEQIRQIEEKLSTSMIGTEGQSARWVQCIEYLYWELPLATGALYVRKFFDKSLKSDVEKLVNEIRTSYEIILKKVDWMDDKTKKAALNKLKSIQSHVAYPVEFFDDKILDSYFEDLKPDPDNFLQSHLRLNLFNLDQELQKLGKIVNKTNWVTHGYSADVNAYYYPTENSIEILAGYIQEEFFVKDRPKYMNYASTGHFIGHEFTHALDDEGIQYDEEGNLDNWWDAKTYEEYKKRMQCIVDQYNNYTVKGLRFNVDGVNTLGENIADNGGIKVAYFSYEEYVRINGPEPHLPLLPYSPKQLFWISVAGVYCEKHRLEYSEDFLITNEHSPGEFRVIGSLSNMLEFAKDFNCPTGSRMNPHKKCIIW